MIFGGLPSFRVGGGGDSPGAGCLGATLAVLFMLTLFGLFFALLYFAVRDSLGVG